MDNLVRDIDEAIGTGKFTHESINWLRAFRKKAEVYERTLNDIAGSLYDDADCLKKWAKEALDSK